MNELTKDDLALLDKRCERCGSVKPWSEFAMRKQRLSDEIRPARICDLCYGVARGFLPAAPFVTWCRQRMADDDIGPTVFAARIAIPERRLADVLRGRSRFVSFAAVDRALTKDGWHISQVYPDLYPDAPQDVIDLLQQVAASAAVEEWENERKAA